VHPYPHQYTALAIGAPTDAVTLESAELPRLETAAPPEFDGPGGLWSPETLLCASLADCFILTFRAVSRIAQLPWLHLECRVQGLLERVERQSQFTHFTTYAHLVVPDGVDFAKAKMLLEQAERGCLIANSLRGVRTLETEVTTR
jgi:organic hydroperoxide reductase OsmC/OhrA